MHRQRPSNHSYSLGAQLKQDPPIQTNLWISVLFPYEEYAYDHGKVPYHIGILMRGDQRTLETVGPG